jgi:WD40 repeat protein
MAGVAAVAAYLSGVGLLVWWLLFPTPRKTWTLPDSSSCLLLSRDGRTLVTVTGKEGEKPYDWLTVCPSGPVRLWDVATGRERLRVLSPDVQVVWADLSADGTCLAVENCFGGLTVWDANTGGQRAYLHTTADINRSMRDPRNARFSPDGRWLAFERDDRQAVLFWDTAAGRVCSTLKGIRGPFAFSADGQTLAAGAEDAVARIWDMTTGKERVALQGQVASLDAVVLSPDGRLAVTGSTPRDAVGYCELRLWRADTGLPVRLLEAGEGHFLGRLEFSPDGRLLLEPYELWDVTTPRPTPLCLLAVHNRITAASGGCWGPIGPYRPPPVLSPDGRWLAFPADKEGSLTVLDTATLATQAALDLTDGSGSYLEPVFSANGRTLAVQVSRTSSAFQERLDGLFQWLAGQGVAGSSESVVKVFDVASGAELARLPGSPHWYPTVIGFTPDGQTLLTRAIEEDPARGKSYRMVSVWDVPRRSRWLWLGFALTPVVALAWRHRRGLRGPTSSC